jgi:hypothetical protein
MHNTTQPVPARLRAGHHTGARAKACCLLIHAEASLFLSLNEVRHAKPSFTTFRVLAQGFRVGLPRCSGAS